MTTSISPSPLLTTNSDWRASTRLGALGILVGFGLAGACVAVP